jgi:dTDP-4-amino-4,6-dideoxy-D-galactose acyltransferase
MGEVVEALVAARSTKLIFYSPYAGLRALDPTKQQELFGTGKARSFTTHPDHYLFEVASANGPIQFLYQQLPWDTDFFGAPTYKLFTALYADETPLAELTRAARVFRQELQKPRFYCFAELPTEDSKLIQALTSAGWRCVENRLTYFYDAIGSFRHARYAVRGARADEAAYIGAIAATARNEYDRFHADDWFGQELADAFLARYASAAVLGYCDQVLVPNEPATSVDSFLAISDLKTDAEHLGCGLSRVVLTAAGIANRGWHLKLVAETIQRARELNQHYVLMTTQATNRPVFRTCEKLGFKLGGCSQLLACSA